MCDNFKGELSPNLFYEMSLPEIAVHNEKLLPKVVWRLGKGDPSKIQC